jgi:hypothetical protein
MRLTTTKFLGLALVLLATSVQAALINLTPQPGNSNSATSVKLSDLLSGQVMGVKVGDKDFTGFSYSTIPGDDMPAPANVNVLGFRDSEGNWGVSFHGGFLDLPGGTGLSDAKLRFRVSVDPVGLRQGFRISDAHLFAAGIGVGPDSFFAIDESFEGLNNSMSVFKSTLGGSQTQQLFDWTYFDEPMESIVVTKDILAIAGANSTQPARSTVIDQSFSQTIIPEPATVAIALLGLVGFAAVRRGN